VNARSRIEARLFSTAPGRRYVAGTAATVLPEDYNEAGALWEHLTRHGVSFYNFGFGTEMPASLEQQMFKETGIRMSVSFPLPKPLFDRTSRFYPTFNMAIPDQYRVDVFEQELRERWESGREPFPQLVTMVLPQDHLTDPHPDDGYPFRESYMADNDLALGRVVEAVSKSPFWKNTLIVALEDDAQNGPDHVDSHRSVLLTISAYSRAGTVHRFTNTTDVLATIEHVLGLDALSQFDHYGRPLREIWTTEPDLRPYTALVPSVSLDARNPGGGRGARESAQLDFDFEDVAEERAFNRVLWRAIKGDAVPYPGVNRMSALEWKRGW